MKKIFLLFAFISLNSFSYTRLSSDEYLGGIFTSKATKEIMKDAFDYENDLAVVSDRMVTIEDVKIDAISGLQNSIYDYSYSKLKTLLEETKLSGTNFDYETMKLIAEEVAKEIVENKKYTISKTVEIQNTNKYLSLAKISREEVSKITVEKFRKRLFNVVQRLNDIYHELGK
ncbi:hypothetical protein STFE110948_01245 [Streptobacillus felis]|uniref:Uncharacterized protein n=1 Tax=Streptobacillus felis TaxID=1384509 RepID=A0A7Z0PE16_9FUSO|nr:hypothetical protein [Streptobacillus felis]NYV27447.1 hypothetical protein [Streptobacillus felis]